MPLQIGPLTVHPQGEVLEPRTTTAREVLEPPLTVDTHGRRFHVQWDPQASVTPLGQLVFFSQFLATAGLFRDWVQTCPLTFTSHNAPLTPICWARSRWPFSPGKTVTPTSPPCAPTRSIPRAWA